jgi:hypothetical protein
MIFGRDELSLGPKNARDELPTTQSGSTELAEVLRRGQVLGVSDLIARARHSVATAACSSDGKPVTARATTGPDQHSVLCAPDQSLQARPLAV